jgi:secreted PhoX family phosphatase
VNRFLDKGTLYVAVFKDDGTGEWKALTHGQGALTNAYAKYAFADQADVLINARLAGDALGATKMDRPEWVSVSPVTGEVYVTLTNNSNRTPTKHGMNAANPRNYAGDKGNRNGHIIRWAEKGNDHTATSFNWDIYLFAAPNDLTAENLSGLNANNDLSSPDGLYFDPRGVLWIQTDDGAYTSKTNCMLLAALPGKVNDGKEVTTSAGIKTRVGMQANEQNIKRFFVGPKGCEVTGITLTPDFKTLFINIQHPGEDQPGVTWGAIAGGTTPRSATVMITKKDGGVILGESLK